MSRPVVTVSVAPDAAPVSLADVKKHLRVDWTDEDEIIQSYIDAAVQLLDGPTGRLGRGIVTQTWQHVCQRPERDRRVWLTAQPNEIVSIRLRGADEAQQSALLADFRVHSDGYQFAVEPVTGKEWPSLACRWDAIEITFTTGFASDKVPQPIRQAILLLVGHWYKEREAVTNAPLREMPFAVEALLDPYKIGFVA